MVMAFALPVSDEYGNDTEAFSLRYLGFKKLFVLIFAMAIGNSA